MRPDSTNALGLRLRRDLAVSRADSSIVLRIPGATYNLQPTSQELVDKWALTLSFLREPHFSSELLGELQTDPACRRLLELLNSLSLLILVADGPGGERSAAPVHSRVRAAVTCSELMKAGPGFLDYLKAGNVEYRVLRGMAMEQYQITRRAHRALMPALSSATGSFRSVLCRLVAEEYGHDKMMANGVRGFGLDELEIDRLLPLPYVEALTTRLLISARSNPRLFSLMLYMFERDSPMDESATSMLARHGAPAEFVHARREHARINRDGKHEDISLELFSLLGPVPVEEERALAQEMWTLARLFQSAADQILDYYGNKTNPEIRNVETLRPLLDGDQQDLLVRSFSLVRSSARIEAATRRLQSSVLTALCTSYEYCGMATGDRDWLLRSIADWSHTESTKSSVVGLSDVPLALVALEDALRELAMSDLVLLLKMTDLVQRCLKAIPGESVGNLEQLPRAGSDAPPLELHAATIAARAGWEIRVTELLILLRAEFDSTDWVGAVPMSSLDL